MNIEQQRAIALAKARRRMEEEQKQLIGRPASILIEPVAQMVSGILGTGAGYAAGGGRAAAPKITGGRYNLPAGTEWQEGISGAMQYQPKSKIGQIGQDLISRGIETISDVTEEVPAYAAARGEEIFGDPALAEQTAQSVRDRGFFPTIANRLLDEQMIGPYGHAAISATPILGGILGGGAAGLAKYAGGRRQIAEELRRRQATGEGRLPVEQQAPTFSGDAGQWRGTPVRPPEVVEGITDKDLARYKLAQGKAVKDESYNGLVRLGADPAALTEFKAAPQPTKAAMVEMTKVKRNQKMSRRYKTYNRPLDIVGKEMNPLISYVRTKNKASGAKIGEAAEDLKGQTVDISQARNDFLDSAESMGIKLTDSMNDDAFWKGPKGKVLKRIRKLYDDSALDLLGKYQKPLTNVIYKFGMNQQPDAYDLHMLKRFIDENVTYGKAEGGMSASVSNTLKEFRTGIDAALDDKFTAYRIANDEYSETIRALDSLQDVLPKRVNFGMKNFEEALGQEMRNIETNYGKRMAVRNAAEEIQRVHNKYRPNKQYQGDLGVLVGYANDLDKWFGEAPAGSLPGIMETTAGRIVAGDRPGRATVESIKQRFSQTLAPEDEEAFNMLMDMITSQ